MKSKTDKQLAQQWKCDERTIRRWRKAGAPLNNPKQLRSWLAGQKKIPAGTAELLKRMRSTEIAQGANLEQKLAEGPLPALKRLGEMEARAYTDFKRAIASGDPFEIKLARESWIKISESQRRADLAIEQSRRDAGELIPRESMETLCRWYNRALYEMRFGWLDIVPSPVGLDKPADICRVLQRAYTNMSGTLTAYLCRDHSDVPAWMRKAAAMPWTPAAKLDEAFEREQKVWTGLCKVILNAALDEKAQIGAEKRNKKNL